MGIPIIRQFYVRLIFIMEIRLSGKKDGLYIKNGAQLWPLFAELTNQTFNLYTIHNMNMIINETILISHKHLRKVSLYM